MALIVKDLELPDGQILEEAYLKVQSINTANVDYEFLEPISENESKVSWLTRIETRATIFVYADKLAREHRVPALHWFSYEIEYNLSEWQNIYEQAYFKLKEIYPEGEDD